MVAAAFALIVLVVLPLGFLAWGSLSGEGRLTLEHFAEALSNRLYVTALRNSLVLGVWTAVLSTVIGLPLGAALALFQFPGRRVAAILMSSLMGMPPVVVGLVVYLLLSRSGPLGVFGRGDQHRCRRRISIALNVRVELRFRRPERLGHFGDKVEIGLVQQERSDIRGLVAVALEHLLNDARQFARSMQNHGAAVHE